ncbi:MAG: hypothetical protein E7E51_05700 [Staphylococcus epidermidis]|nr:hypothetical protein [Staphylococcus epidermidis]
MKKVFPLFFVFILIVSGCSSNSSTKSEKDENITVSAKDKSYKIKDSFSEKPKDIEVIKLEDNGSENITNKGIVKKEGNKISWKGTPDKYKDLEDLLGKKVKYKVYLEDDNNIEKELKIKYK